MPSPKNKLRVAVRKSRQLIKLETQLRERRRPRVDEREPRSDQEKNDLRLLFFLKEARDQATANDERTPSMRSLVFSLVADSAARNRGALELEDEKFRYLTDRRKTEATLARMRRLWRAKYGKW